MQYSAYTTSAMNMGPGKQVVFIIGEYMAEQL